MQYLWLGNKGLGSKVSLRQQKPKSKQQEQMGMASILHNSHLWGESSLCLLKLTILLCVVSAVTCAG